MIWRPLLCRAGFVLPDISQLPRKGNELAALATRGPVTGRQRQPLLARLVEHLHALRAVRILSVCAHDRVGDVKGALDDGDSPVARVGVGLGIFQPAVEHAPRLGEIAAQRDRRLVADVHGPVRRDGCPWSVLVSRGPALLDGACGSASAASALGARLRLIRSVPRGNVTFARRATPTFYGHVNADRARSLLGFTSTPTGAPTFTCSMARLSVFLSVLVFVLVSVSVSVFVLVFVEPGDGRRHGRGSGPAAPVEAGRRRRLIHHRQLHCLAPATEAQAPGDGTPATPPPRPRGARPAQPSRPWSSASSSLGSRSPHPRCLPPPTAHPRVPCLTPLDRRRSMEADGHLSTTSRPHCCC